MSCIEEFEEHLANNDGFCTGCAAWVVWGGVELDAEGLDCPECGGESVIGAGLAIIELC